MRLTTASPRRDAVGLLLAVVLSACSGGSSDPKATPSAASPSSPAAVTPSRGATPTPTKTNAAASGVPAAGRLSSWSGCGSGFQCATLTVVLDPKRPGLGTIDLALTRHKATGSRRIGSLITNPGGPGESAVDWLKRAYDGFPSEIRSRFDIVTFDPRGVGHTAPVRCLSTSELDAYFHLDPAPDNASERSALVAGSQKLDAGCGRRSGRVLPYVDTRQVAQDLDRVRQAVGDSKLTYLGYSYGTAIGAAYLDQFPTRVRAMVLDGALDPAMSWEDFLRGQSAGFDTALASFLEDCEKNNCAFRDSVSGDLTKAFDDLAARIDAHPLPGDGSRVVGPGEFTLGVGAGLYSRRNGWPAIAEALARAERGDGSVLLGLADSYYERGDKGYSNLTEANIAVNCIDRPWPRTAEPYFTLAADVARTSPRFGPMIALSGLSCVGWPLRATGTPHAVHAPGSPPVVVIGTTRDPATPYIWSQALAGQLSRGVLITHVGDGHTVYRSGAPRCIVRPVDDYLISLRVPVSSRC
ncbi:MAG: alpha/beta hydrolase [Actinomycetota bacterium]|nr:alpha/beta hydrolase [Actinomycetota bacterium]